MKEGQWMEGVKWGSGWEPGRSSLGEWEGRNLRLGHFLHSSHIVCLALDLPTSSLHGADAHRASWTCQLAVGDLLQPLLVQGLREGSGNTG